MSEFDRITSPYVDRSCYVWGGQGENICTQERSGKLDPEGWLTYKESKSVSPESNAKRVITLYRKRIAEGVNPVYAFDCSGYVIEMLKKMGLFSATYDTTAKVLYTKCDSHPSREELRQGDLVFYSKTGKASDISHVGFYLGGDIVRECRGRDYGVVDTGWDDIPANWDAPWNLYGRFEAVAPFIVEEPEVPYIFDLTSPRQKGNKVEALQWFLNFCNYPDENGNALTEDGILGPHSWAALEMFSAYYAPKLPPPVPHTVTICTEPFSVVIDNHVLSKGGGEA